MLAFRTSIVLLLLAVSPSADALAETSIYFGPVRGETAFGVDATRLYKHLGIDTGDNAPSTPNPIGPAISRLSKKIIDRIDAHDGFTHFFRPVGAFEELPDDVLLLVVSVESAEEQHARADSGRGTFTLEYPVLAVVLQLADPRTGQVVYSRFDFASGVDHYRKNPTLSRALPEDHVEWTDRAVWKHEGGQTWAGREKSHYYATMIDQMSMALVEEMLEVFVSDPVEAQVVRRVDRRNNLFLLNQGRKAGLFTNSRLATSDGTLVFAIKESYPEYSIAHVAHGDPDAAVPWTGVRGYQAASGAGSILTSVSRIVLSPDILEHPNLARLNEDEQCLLASMSGEQCSPIYQSMMATRLTEALEKTGGFRMVYPAAGLASLNRAKARMNKDLQLRQREGDPYFFESLVIPDQVIIAVLSSPLLGVKPYVGDGRIIDNVKTHYSEILGSLHLCDLESGNVLASGSGHGKTSEAETYSTGTGLPVLVFDSNAGKMLAGCVVDPAMELSVFRNSCASLMENYQSIDLQASLEGSVLNCDTPTALKTGESLHVCEVIGNLPLEEGGGRVTPILRQVGSGHVHRQGGRWELDFTPADVGVDYSESELVVPLYGRNAKQTDSSGLGSISVSGRAAEGIPMSDVDATLLLLAEVSKFPDIPVVLPTYVLERADAFHNAKFRSGLVYRDSETLNSREDSVGLSHELGIEILEATADVDPKSSTHKKKVLEQRIAIQFSFRKPDGTDLCNTGTVKSKGWPGVAERKSVEIDDYEGYGFARRWIDKSVERFRGYYQKRILPALRP